MADLQPERTPLVATAALLLALLLAGLVADCGRCHAAEPEPDSVGLRAGQAAPFAGLLVPPLAARALLQAQDDLDAARARRELDEEQHRADLAAVEARLQAVERARLACERDRVPLPRVRSWYEAPGVLLGAGVLLGLGAAIAVVEVAR